MSIFIHKISPNPSLSKRGIKENMPVELRYILLPVTPVAFLISNGVYSTFKISLLNIADNHNKGHR